MTAVMSLPSYAGETGAIEYQVAHSVPPSFDYFQYTDPPETIKELVDCYNYLQERGGPEALFSRLPSDERANNGLTFTVFGEPSKALVLLQNPFATDLSPVNKLRGQFLYDSMVAEHVKSPDGTTPQVLQIASASRKADMPLSVKDHLRLAGGDVRPIADKVAQVVFENAPRAEKVISVGYSLSGFLTPDILMSISKYKDVLAALIANPPGVQTESMTSVLKSFARAGEKAAEHLASSGILALQPKNILSTTTKVREKAEVIADVVWRPTNLSLWSAFAKGQFLNRINELHQISPSTAIDIAFGYEDPLCSPMSLESFLLDSPYGATVIEKGDHAWGMNLPRSLGNLVTKQVRNILVPQSGKSSVHPVA